MRCVRVAAALGSVLMFMASPAKADFTYANAEAAFQADTVDDRVRLQLLLAADGYLNSVPIVQFSRHAFAGIKTFQEENGFAATGEFASNPSEYLRLRNTADEMLDFWGFAQIQHPTSSVRLWIPGNLGLVRHSNRYGYDYQDPAKRIEIQFFSFPNTSVVTSMLSTVKWLEQRGGLIHYKVAKDDWYVVSATTPDGQDWYVRYHQDGNSTTGFTLIWNNANGNIHGERIATLMSASLWADRTGAPMLTPWELRGSRSQDIRPDVANNQVEEPPQARPPDAQTAPSPPKASSEKTGFSTGTGFFVDDGGDLLTNFHVIDGCANILVRLPDKSVVPANAIARDEANDLALLKVERATPRAAPFRTDVKLGEPVAAFGFPHADIMSSSGSFTLGNVTSMSGLHDDSRYVQISAPVQAGNSGGPLFDYDGNIIGIVSSKLNALKIAIATNDLPQNVNFAIKGYVIASFLDANKIKTIPAIHLQKPLRPPELPRLHKA